jgi:hypothetical protein
MVQSRRVGIGADWPAIPGRNGAAVARSFLKMICGWQGATGGLSPTLPHSC